MTIPASPPIPPTPETESNVEWIAIEPPSRGVAPLNNGPSVNIDFNSGVPPPSFADSQFDVILRRKRTRRVGERKLPTPNVPSRFIHLSNDWEFAGWGSTTRLTLDDADRAAGEAALKAHHGEKTLGQLTASAVAANDLLGGIFYTLPPAFEAASVFAPISLVVATLTLFLWRPVMAELGSAIPLSGSVYTYLLNVSTKPLAMLGAALLLLDLSATAVVSAATASSYLISAIPTPGVIPPWAVAILLLALFTVLSLAGVREGARAALTVLSLHIVTMVVLMIAAIVTWARTGNKQLRENWVAGQPSATKEIPRQIFDGVVLGVLGLTGFECASDYAGRVKDGRYPSVLRNLHLPSIVLYGTMALLVLAVLPIGDIIGAANVLSVLGERCGGPWLRLWIVVDAILVLCGGILTGILSSSELLKKLAQNRVVPQVFLSSVPITGAPYVAILSFIVFSGVLYASTSANLTIVSKMFSLVWLVVMSLFPVCVLLMKFNRGRLPRRPRTRLRVILTTLALCAAIFAGNIALDPTTFGYFAAYTIAVYIFFATSQNKVELLRWAYWIYDQSPALHSLHFTERWGNRLVGVMSRLRRQPVCVLAKSDEIDHLFRMILYVSRNECTSCVKLVHFHDHRQGVPSEMEANAKILDEAFPEITIDLILVDASFTPSNVSALAHRLRIPTALMFIRCPGEDFPYNVAEFGTRIIAL